MKEDEGIQQPFLPHYVRARAYLPDFEVESYPPVAFVLFAPDARGYDTVVLDVFHTIDQREYLLRFVAHEFHH